MVTIPRSDDLIGTLGTEDDTRARQRLGASIGGSTTQLRHGEVVAARARKGLWQKFLDAADPDGILTDVERERKAKRLLDIHMRQCALASLQARAAKKRQKNGAGSTATTPQTRETPAA